MNLPNAERLLRLLALKRVLRKGWTRHPVPQGAIESVADHSYGMALLAWLLCPPDLDQGRVLELALLHDLAEAVTGDLTPADKVPEEVKRRSEREALAGLLSGFELAERGAALLVEYQEQETPEARWVKAADKLDMSLQSLIYEQAYGGDLSEFRESARPALEKAGLLEWLR